MQDRKRWTAVRPGHQVPLAGLTHRRTSTREVNIEELGARIEGINLSLRNLEAELNEKRDFTADELDSLLSRLDILCCGRKT